MNWNILVVQNDTPVKSVVMASERDCSTKKINIQYLFECKP